MLEIRECRESEVSAKNDRDWNTEVTLEIGPHPALSETQAKIIALDYGMRGGNSSCPIGSARSLS